MAEDWGADVKKFVPDADDGVIKAIVRYCGIALQKRDSSLVSFSDPVETGRVRENFLKKKLGLTQSDAELDTAIAAVGERMKGANFKNRVTVYYLLLEHLGLMEAFGGVSKAAGLAAGVAGAAGAGALGIANLAGSAADTAKSAGETAVAAGGSVVAAASDAASAAVDTVSDAGSAVAAKAGAGLSAVTGAASALGASALGATSALASSVTDSAATAAGGGSNGYSSNDSDDHDSRWSWLIWLLLALLAAFLLWWLLTGPHKICDHGDAAATTAAAPVAPAPDASAAAAALPAALASAPAEGSVTIPTGAGVTTELRDGKPVVKVYFDTGKAAVAPAFGASAAALKDYLTSHAGSTLEVSGYNDTTGNAALNAALSKRRAQAVGTELVTAGIPEASVALVKPDNATDASADKAAARRVEVVIK